MTALCSPTSSLENNTVQAKTRHGTTVQDFLSLRKITGRDWPLVRQRAPAAR
jgi:hypothetical protein